MANIKQVNPYGKFDASLGKFFSTDKARKEYVKNHNLIESPPMISNKKMVNDSVAEINYERKKCGQKELSSARLVGNSQASRYVGKVFSVPDVPWLKK